MFRLWPKGPDKKIIAQAKGDDFADCAEIHRRSFSIGWDEHVLTGMSGSRGSHCLVAKSVKNGRRVYGFLLYRIVAKEAEILTICVDPAKRKTGTGAALLEEMIRHCLTERLEEIFLEVDETNHSAVNLYKRHGFLKVGERKGYYKSDNDQAIKGNQTAPIAASNALIMRLDLLA